MSRAFAVPEVEKSRRREARVGYRIPPPVPRLEQSIPSDLIARKWIVEKPDVATPKKGKKNKELLLGAFKEICPLSRLVKRGADLRLELASGGTIKPNRKKGCGCLKIVERDVEELEQGRPSVLKKVPRIEVAPNAWSSTKASVTMPTVTVRHPVDPFRWGYWTATDKRQVKQFYRTVAHEVCGHMVPLILGIKSSRRSKKGHNQAILRENEIATEHGVPSSELRGLDKTEGSTKAGKHRGESFLQSSLGNFSHGSSSLPSGFNKIVSSAIGTIRHFAARSSDRVMIQVEGFAYPNEGGIKVAKARVTAARRELTRQLKKQSIALKTKATKDPRFAADQTTLLTGKSKINSADPQRRIHIYLFHRSHSAGP